ncbi:MAG: hypothetical protein E6G64_16285 [Actinobacteria bacterium]|nr:MAG: hypothetical protein E6G64_16285 [Actinomycetota bacterium]
MNFMRGSTLIAQARATALTGSTNLTVPFPTQATAITTNVPGLSAGTVQAQVWQQTASNSFSLIGSAALTVTDTRGAAVITPSTIDLLNPPASFTITGNGFADLGFGLPVVNFMRGTTLIAQARATALTGSTTLTVPFPTQATAITPNMPGLSGRGRHHAEHDRPAEPAGQLHDHGQRLRRPRVRPARRELHARHHPARSSAGHRAQREHDADGALPDAGNCDHTQSAWTVGGLGRGSGLAADRDWLIHADRKRRADGHGELSVNAADHTGR